MAESGMSIEDVLTLISTMNEKQQENMMKFASELRKPTDIEQAKLDKEREALEAKMQRRIAAARAEAQGKEMAKLGCTHTMPNGRHTWRGQVNQDGYIRPICLRCPTVLPPIKATPEQIKEGVNFEQILSIDLAMLELAAQKTAMLPGAPK